MIYDDNEICYVHLRTIDPQTGHETTHGGATVAYIPEAGSLRIALSRCNAKDNFCRRVGRSIAKGRLNAGLYAVIARPPHQDYERPDRKIDTQAAVDWAKNKIEAERNKAYTNRY